MPGCAANKAVHASYPPFYMQRTSGQGDRVVLGKLLAIESAG